METRMTAKELHDLACNDHSLRQFIEDVKARLTAQIPDQRVAVWLHAIAEDLLVQGDAFYRTLPDSELLPLDAATIRLIVDENWKTPAPPSPAYQQVVDGKVVATFTTAQLTRIRFSGDGLYGKGIVEEYAQTGILLSVDAIMKIQTGLLGI